MSDTRTFHISDVLSILTDHLVSTRHMDGVYDILGFMTDSSPFTHQLPRLSEEVKPYLAAAHPELAQVTFPEDFSPETREEALALIDAWMKDLTQQHGETVEVSRIPTEAHTEAHTEIHPLEELAMMRPDVEPIVITLPDDQES